MEITNHIVNYNNIVFLYLIKNIVNFEVPNNKVKIKIQPNNNSNNKSNFKISNLSKCKKYFDKSMCHKNRQH